MQADVLTQRLEQIVREDAHLMHLLRAARRLDFPQWRVVAGCIYQTVWNTLTGRPPGTGIRDYDVIYFDAADVSWEAEAAMHDRMARKASALPAPVEVRNQARVHLWFQDHFGIPYAPLATADEALTRYACTTHAVGIRLMDEDRLEIFAPFGLEDIFAMILRPNRVLPNRVTHEKKAARAKATWSELTVIAWD